jgi:hypothetical protein
MRASRLLVAILPLAAACYEWTGPRPAEVSSPTEVALKVGQEVRVDAVLSLAFLGVPADSRCPSRLACFWAGDAAVAIAYAAGTGPSRPDTLHTTLDPRDVRFSGYTIRLVGLTPYPETPTPIPADSYAARFRIEPVPALQAAR